MITQVSSQKQHLRKDMQRSVGIFLTAEVQSRSLELLFWETSTVWAWRQNEPVRQDKPVRQDETVIQDETVRQGETVGQDEPVR